MLGLNGFLPLFFLDGRSSNTGSGLPGPEAADPTAEGAPGLKKKCRPSFQQFTLNAREFFTPIILFGRHSMRLILDLFQTGLKYPKSKNIKKSFWKLANVLKW
jgi:hypothetical protein